MKRSHLILAALAALTAALMLACGLSVWTWQSRAAQLNTSSDWVTPMCVWRQGNQVGLWWNSRVPVALAQANASRNLCFATPWLPFLPFQGAPTLTLPW